VALDLLLIMALAMALAAEVSSASAVIPIIQERLADLLHRLACHHHHYRREEAVEGG